MRDQSVRRPGAASLLLVALCLVVLTVPAAAAPRLVAADATPAPIIEAISIDLPHWAADLAVSDAAAGSVVEAERVGGNKVSLGFRESVIVTGLHGRQPEVGQLGRAQITVKSGSATMWTEASYNDPKTGNVNAVTLPVIAEYIPAEEPAGAHTQLRMSGIENNPTKGTALALFADAPTTVTATIYDEHNAEAGRVEIPIYQYPGSSGVAAYVELPAGMAVELGSVAIERRSVGFTPPAVRVTAVAFVFDRASGSPRVVMPQRQVSIAVP